MASRGGNHSVERPRERVIKKLNTKEEAHELFSSFFALMERYKGSWTSIVEGDKVLVNGEASLEGWIRFDGGNINVRKIYILEEAS